MLKLTVPITISPDVYTALLPVRVEFDLRAQRGDFYLAPIKTTSAAVYLGIEERTNAGVEYRHPELMRTVTLSQNLATPDPLVQALLKSIVVWMENVEQIIADSLTNEVIQIGTKKWSLASTFEAIGSKAVTNELNDLRSPPTAARSVKRTRGPLITRASRRVCRTINPTVTIT